jgi:GH35 family endo-1,4-beta-xylanase
MKHYKYYYLAALSLGLLSSCADDLTQNMTVESVPLSVQVMEELKNLEPLKSYKTASNMSQNFKIGGAVSAEDFAKGGNIGALASANLDEVTTKTEMLYGSCVADDGATDFGNVNTLVDAAKKANVGVFGSALIWNSNQRPAYYQALFDKRGEQIKEEKIKEMGDLPKQTVFEPVEYDKSDLTKITEFPFFVMGYTPEFSAENGLISVHPGSWYQYFIADGIKTVPGETYAIEVEIRGEGEGSFKANMGWGWGEGESTSTTVSFTDQWEKKQFEFADPVGKESCNVVFQPGGLTTTFYVKSIKILHKTEQAGPVEVTVYESDLTKVTSFPFFVMGYTPEYDAENGLNSVHPGSWYQYFIADQIPTKAGEKYGIEVEIRGEGAGSFKANMGWGWGEGESTSTTVSFTDQWETKKFEFADPVGKESCNVVFQPGGLTTTFYVRNIKVIHYEVPSLEPEATTIEKNIVENSDCEGSENGNYVVRIKNAGGDVNASFSDGGKSGKCIKIDVAAKVDNPWDNQFFITVPDFKDIIDPESKVELKMDVKAAVAQKISVQTHAAPGDYVGGFGDINAETDWKTFTLKASMPKHAEKGQSYSLAFNLNDGDGVANTFYLDNITLTIEEKIPAGEISGEEKSKILTNVIDNWVKGLMDNTSGYVKAWDVVSDPVSDGAVQKDGGYGLQSTDKPNTKKEYKDVFFWQDYLGDVDYVRYAVSAARRHFKGAKEDLKLFVNDYGLDSDPKKCESLVKWLGKWENDTVKIDGIGVQLHLTCSENESDNTTTISNISTMLSTLAATGKLVRISELDVVFKDNSGAEVKVSSDDYKAKGCEEKIGAFYKSVIAAYLSGVPSAQQYGICQWSLIDENDLPKGLWSDKFLRKQTFKGFADGLSGK